jgi:uncharacterized protein involved in exopolysaccharide biosynthesis
MTNNNTTVEEIYTELDLVDARIEEIGKQMREAIAKIRDAYDAEYSELTAKRRALYKDLVALDA